jgi:glutamate dehydrogenase (NAD(P)+)
MGRRFEESSNRRLLRAVEELTGLRLKPETLAEVAAGAGELDLVNSGLEDTMVSAYQEIVEIARREAIDLRSAAYVSAINRVARSYMSRGIFP